MMHEEQQNALKAIESGQNVCITGSAGTGKTWVIRQIMKLETNRKINIVAMTGCAAKLIDVRVRTLHSWAGIGYGQLDAKEYVSKILRREDVRKRWCETDCLVIDEKSMLGKHLIEKLDYIGRYVRQQLDKFFGGLQIVLVGDFYQLPPISSCRVEWGKPHEEEPFVFEWTSFHQAFPVIIVFTYNHRQSEDRIWNEMLQELRQGICSEKTEQMLQHQVSSSHHDNIHLFSTNRDVDRINQRNLEKIIKNHPERKTRVFTPSFEIPREKKKGYRQYSDIQLQQLLCQYVNITMDGIQLIEDARVMLTYNLDFDQGLVNGSIGTVIRFSTTNPIVRFDDPVCEMEIFPVKVEFEEKSGLFIQYIPLRLSWAVSIHKIQGQTLLHGNVDVGSTVFEYGQMYVALSRFKRLADVHLESFDKAKLKAHPKVRAFYDSISTSK